MNLTQADYEFYTINFNNAFFERLKNEKETIGELKIQFEIMANFVPLLAGPVKIDSLVMPKKPTLMQPQRPCYKPSDLVDKYGFRIESYKLPSLPDFEPLEGFAFDTIDTLEIPKGVKKIHEQTFFDFKSRIFNKVWKLNRLILPSTGLTDVYDLSFAGLMPKEIYFRDKNGELTENSKRFKVIQGKNSARSDGCAILIDLKTATRLIPSETVLHEYHVLKKECPEIAEEWQKMPYDDLIKFTLFCDYFSSPYKEWSYKHRTGENHCTLNELKNAVFNLRNGESPNEEFMWENKYITKEIFEQISHYSKLISDVVLANRIEEEFIKLNPYAHSFFDERYTECKKNAVIFPSQKMKNIEEIQKNIYLEERRFCAKYFIAALKDLAHKHNLLLFATLEEEKKYSHKLELFYEITLPEIFTEKDNFDMRYDFCERFEKIKQKVEALS